MNLAIKIRQDCRPLPSFVAVTPTEYKTPTTSLVPLRNIIMKCNCICFLIMNQSTTNVQSKTK